MADLPIRYEHNIDPPDNVLGMWQEIRINEVKSLIESKKIQIVDIERIQLKRLKADLAMLEEKLKHFENEAAKKAAIDITKEG